MGWFLEWGPFVTKLVVGLGNPGSEYQNTRHNIGFRVIDLLAQGWRLNLDRKKFQSHFAEFLSPSGEKVVLVQPMTFMNLSGESVASWVNFLKIPGEDLLVIHDELDLPLGKFKAQWAAGPAGHNGVRSIIEKLGHQQFNRLRVGVGHPGRSQQVKGHVLSAFRKDEILCVEEILTKAVQAVSLFLEKGLDPVAQLVNRSPAPGA